MRNFPVHLIRPLSVKLWGSSKSASIEIPLAPFDLDGNAIQTTIWLENIRLPSTKLSRLQKQQFTFPSNPRNGYIDGSVYIQHAHHPVDVSSILFGILGPLGLPLTVEATMLLDCEGLMDYAATAIRIETIVETEQVWRPVQHYGPAAGDPRIHQGISI